MKTIFIATLPRTGSSLLAADMRSTHALGEPREWFLPNRMDRLVAQWGLPEGDLDAYIKRLTRKKSTDNGVVAVKLMPAHLRSMSEAGMLPAAGRLAALLERFEGDTLVIRLLRGDKLRQAISLLKARQTGKWGVLKEAKAEAKYNYAELAKLIVQLAKWEAQWERELETSDIVPAIDMMYEDLPSRRDETLLDIARRLDLDDPEAIVANREREEIKLRRQADNLTEAWYDRFASINQ